MQRPLVGIAISAILGTWLGFTFHLPPAGLAVSFAALASVTLLAVYLRRMGSIILVHACTLLAAWIAATLSMTQTSLDIDLETPEHRSVPLEIRGTIAGDPGSSGYASRRWSAYLFPLKVEAVKMPGKAWSDARGKIGVRWYGPAAPDTPSRPGYRSSTPRYGERWYMKGAARAKRHPKPGCANYTFSTGKTTSGKLSNGPVYSLARLLLRARRNAAELLTEGIEDRARATGLLQALLLGYRNELNPDLHALFSTTGTLHIFAISGLHVGIICGLLIFLLSVMGIPRTRWIIALAPLLIAYTFTTGAKSSAVRACIMAIVYFFAPLAGRKADSISALALSALVIIAWDPSQLFQVGFILSFTVVLGLIILYPLIYRCIERGFLRFGGAEGSETVMPLFWEHDPAQVQEEPSGRIAGRRAVRYLVSLLAISCSAWLASAPLTAYYFGRFAPIALLGNVFVVPIAFLVVLTGSLALVTGSCATLLAGIFNHANLVFVEMLVGSMKLIARIPGGSVQMTRPPLWLVILWYLALAAAAYACSGYLKRAKVIDIRADEWNHDEDK